MSFQQPLTCSVSTLLVAATLLVGNMFACALPAQEDIVTPAQENGDTIQLLRQQLDEQSRRIEMLESSRGSVDGAPDDPVTRAELQDFFEQLSTEGTVNVGTNGEDRGFFESPSTESRRNATGRLHLDYWGYPQSSSGINQLETGNPLESVEDRFELRRIRLGVRGSVPPRNVTYQLDLEFAGVDQIGIRDAWIALDQIDFVGTVRVGNQKRPYSLEQLNSSNFTVFIERPFIAEVVNEPNRRAGVQSYGVSDDRLFNWRYGIFNMEPIDEDGFVSTNTYQTEVAGRLASTAWYDEACCGENYLHLGVATSFAFPNDDPAETMARFRSRPEARTVNRWLDTGPIGGAQSFQLLGSESVLNLGPFQVGAEYINLWLQRSDLSPDLHFHGGYLYFSYFLTGEHIPWNREMGILGRVDPFQDFIRDENTLQAGLGALQFAVRGSLADLNDADIFGGRASSVTFALNWYWNSHTRLQINYIAGDIRDRELNVLAPSDFASGSYQVIGTRLMIDF